MNGQAEASRSLIGRVVAVGYVVTVSCVAAHGFATGSTETILLAGALALPSSVPAIVGFYMAVGLLGQIPGANPNTSSGSASCSADGVCTSSSTGDAAAWFLLTTDVLGVVALTVAAVANVLLFLAIRAASRRRVSRAGSTSH